MRIQERERPNGVVEYRCPYWRYTIFTCWVVFSLVVLTQVVTYRSSFARGLAIALLSVSVFFAMRAFRMATLQVSSTGLLIRGLYRARRFSWPEIESFRADARRGGYGQSGEVLVINLVNGSVYKAGEFFDRAAQGRANAVAVLVESLNNRLTQQKRA